jgi:hypothetical protein
MAYPLDPSKMTTKQYQKYCSIQGFNQVIRNLNIKFNEIEGGTLKGLIECAKFLHRETETNVPLVPVGKTGYLHNSFQYQPLPTGVGVAEGGLEGTNIESPTFGRVGGHGKHGIRIGYSAGYALWVHEMIGAHFKKVGAGAHWFKAAIERNTDTLLQIIAANTRVK